MRYLKQHYSALRRFMNEGFLLDFYRSSLLFFFAGVVIYLLGLLFPFIMGFLFAYAAVKANKRFFKNDRKLHRGITLTVIYLLVLLLIVLIVFSSTGILRMN